MAGDTFHSPHSPRHCRGVDGAHRMARRCKAGSPPHSLRHCRDEAGARMALHPGRGSGAMDASVLVVDTCAAGKAEVACDLALAVSSQEPWGACLGQGVSCQEVSQVVSSWWAA